MRNKPKRQYSHTGTSVTCDRCGEKHGLKAGTWVINGSGRLVCYGTEQCCFTQEARLVASDYYAGLTLNGWGLFRMIEAHGFQPMKAKHIIPLDGHTSYGYLTEAYVIECLAMYLAAGGEPLI